jgi:hypothetical protein
MSFRDGGSDRGRDGGGDTGRGEVHPDGRADFVGAEEPLRRVGAMASELYSAGISDTEADLPDPVIVPEDEDSGTDARGDSEDTDAGGDSETSDAAGNGADGDAIYDREAAARRDGQLLIESIDELSNDLSDLADRLKERPESQQGISPELAEETRRTQQIRQSVRLLKAIIRDLIAEGVDQSPDLAFRATAQMQATSDNVKRSRKRFGKGKWDAIWDAVRNAASWLWSLISHLVKVKEWTVTGQLGLGAIGLAQASISVTFGE